MNVRQLTASGVLLGAAALALGMSTPAYAVCDAYSGNCPSSPPGGGAVKADVTTKSPSTLPFTGGELVLLSAVGAGALVGGTALVVAGRRKSSPTA